MVANCLVPPGAPNRLSWGAQPVLPARPPPRPPGGAVSTARAERRRALFEASPIGIVEALPDGTILAANDALAHLLGFSVDELPQAPLTRVGADGAATVRRPAAARRGR